MDANFDESEINSPDFTVGAGEDYPDFEVRIWARKGTPLEIGRIDLYRLTEEPEVASVRAPEPNGCTSP